MVCQSYALCCRFNILRMWQNGHHCQITFSKYFSKMKEVAFCIENSLKFIPRAQINNKPTLVEIMAWCAEQAWQATGLDAWASRVKCPARFVSHLHDIYIYIWVVYSFCLFCCLLIIVTTQFVALYKPCKPKPKPPPGAKATNMPSTCKYRPFPKVSK